MGYDSPSAFLADPGRLPFEFRGLARALIEDARPSEINFAARLIQAYAVIAVTLTPRVHRLDKKMPRLGHRCRDILQDDTDLFIRPPRLTFERQGFAVAMFRIIPSTWSPDGWQTPEAALDVICTVLTVHKKQATLSARRFACVGLHALGRRFERATIAARAPCSVVGDLWALVDLAPTGTDRPATTGLWRGNVATSEDGRPFRDVRTFVEFEG